MLYHGDFENPQEAVASILIHMAALGIDLVSVSISAGHLDLETSTVFPADQLEHLGLTEA